MAYLVAWHKMQFGAQRKSTYAAPLWYISYTRPSKYLESQSSLLGLSPLQGRHNGLELWMEVFKVSVSTGQGFIQCPVKYIKSRNHTHKFHTGVFNANWCQWVTIKYRKLVILAMLATGVYCWFMPQLRCYTHNMRQSMIFCVCITKYRNMMFLCVWNRTNPCVTAWGSTSNLNAPKSSIHVKRLKNSDRWSFINTLKQQIMNKNIKTRQTLLITTIILLCPKNC